MRSFFLLFLAAAVFCLPQTATAQLVVESVQVGFPASAENRQDGLTFFKAGAWAPIVVKVKAGENGYPGGKLVVETLDSDDVPNVFTVTIPRLANGRSGHLCTFTRPGSVGAEITISAVDADGRKVSISNKNSEALDFSKQIYLTLGSPAPDLHKALVGHKPLVGLETDPKLRTRHQTHISDVRQMPTRWFGYDAVDLMIFPTGKTAFLKHLLEDNENRKEALAEWVRRGGRLVISVASNQELVANLLKSWKSGAVPLFTGKSLALTRLDGLVQFAETLDKPFEAVDESHPFHVAQLNTKQAGFGPAEILAEEGQEHPLMIRLPYRLGSVTLLATDLDDKPFTAWAGRVEFWQKLVTRLAPKVVAAEENNDIATELQKELEVFPDVRPVSFGWVAFIIFVYILVVGPLDYFFVSKVLKRLEWTWGTFPAVVLGVSAIALIAVSGRQRDEIKVNRIDLIDFDLLESDPPRFYGTSWFTVFSPHNARYAVTIDSPVISWMGRPEISGLNSTGRRSAQALLRGKYGYQDDALTLDDVPVSFASTKSFTASWQGDPICLITFKSSLVYDRDNPEHVTGAVVNYLPVDVHDAVLFYGGRWYTFSGPLLRYQAVGLAEKGAQEFSQWRTVVTARSPGPTSIVSRIIFHEKMTVGNPQRNNVLRALDQSWRIRDVSVREVRTQEAILFGRLPRREDIIAVDEEIKGLDSNSRLSLGTPPFDKPRAWPWAGTLIQDTYVRVFLPVRPAK